MARFALLAALLACFSSTALAQCTPYPDAFSQYQIQLCPLTNAELTPVVMDNPTTITFSSPDTAASPRLRLTFPIMFYGMTWDWLYISNNGALFFGPTPTTLSNSKLPVATSYDDAIPLLAPLFADLYMNAANASVSYSTQGIVGSRLFIVRFTKMNWYTYRLTFPATTASFDVIFYEQPAGKIEIIYYNYSPQPATAGVTTTVGMQSTDNNGAYWSLFNGVSNFSLLSETLHAQRLELTYIGQNIDQVPCSALGYSLETIRGTQLQWTNQTSGEVWYYGICSEVTAAVCDQDTTANKASVCLVERGTEAIDLGQFGPGTFKYQFPLDSNTGMQAVVQASERCTAIGTDRFTTINYVCDSAATSPVFRSASTPFPCVYELTVATSLVCGPGTRGTEPAPYPSSILTRCVRTSGVLYNANLCPRNPRDLAPMAQTAPVQVMKGLISSVFSETVPIGFAFPFYGEEYTELSIGMSASLFFGVPTSTTLSAAPRFGITQTDNYPLIAGFAGYLAGRGYDGMAEAKVMYSNETIDGVRAFVARFQDMRYNAYRGLYDMVVSLDITLYENGHFDIKYYKVAPNALQNTQIGIHGVQFDQYTSVVNFEPMVPALALELQGSVLNFTYSGRGRSEACAAFGANFTDSITQDLVYTDSQGTTYFINPCGRVTSTDACRASSPASSICQVTSTGVANSLTTFNPSAVQWTTSPDLVGLRSIVNDGKWCTTISAPRQLTIDWICNKQVTETQIISVTETSTCVFNIQLYAHAACSSQAACERFNNTFYSGTHCGNVAERITQTDLTSLKSMIPANQYDEGAYRLALPFDFYMYGVAYDMVFVQVNGILSFGIDKIGTPSVAPFHSSSTSQNALPALAAYWCDLEMEQTGNISWSLETVDGRQAFLIRYDNMQYYDTPASSVNFDIFLFPGVDGEIQIRYYNIDIPGTRSRYLSLGIFSDDSMEYDTFVNYQTVTQVMATSWSNSTLNYRYSGPNVDDAACGSFGYDLSPLKNTLLEYEDQNKYFALQVCGVVRNSRCSVRGDRSSMCQALFSATGVNTYNYSLSVWNPNTVVWTAPVTPTGLTKIAADGVYCSTIQKNRATTTNFICDPLATTARMTVSEVTTCVYHVNVTTNLVCAPRNPPPPPPPVLSTMTSCESFPGDVYEARLCPRTLSDPLYEPEVMTNPTRILDRIGTGGRYVDMNHTFFFYNMPFDRFYLTTEGMMIFGSSTTTSSVVKPFPSLGITNLELFPMILPFWNNLNNIDSRDGVLPYLGFIQYSTEGVAPNRRTIVRFQDVDYYTSRESLTERSVSFDVVLSEGEPGDIEIRYYVVDDNVVDNIVIGLKGLNNDHTAVVDFVPISRQFAAKMTGTTLKYHFKGTRQLDFCNGIPGSYNLSSLANKELNWNATVASPTATLAYAYYFTPCGEVTHSRCVNNAGTRQASICRGHQTTATTTLIARDYRAGITWSFPERNTLRATYSTGIACQNAPRRAIVDYMCDYEAIDARILWVNENTTCMTYVQVATSAACSAPANCTSFIGNQYNAQMCNMPLGLIAPPQQTNPISLFSGNIDDGVKMVDIPWQQHIYAGTSNNAWINANGYVTFGSVGANTRQGPLPLSTAVHDSLPAVLGYLTDLYIGNKNGTSNVTWSIEGIAPERYMLIRWFEVNYYTNRPSATSTDLLMSFDIRLYEGIEGTIEILYYDVPHLESSLITIGTQADDGSTWSAIVNNKRMTETGIVLSGNYLKWSFTGMDLTFNRSCGGLGYDFSAYRGTDLSYYDEATRTTVYYNPCGVVKNAACANQTTTERSMACAVTQGATPFTFTYRNLAIYATSGLRWEYLADGALAFSQSGAYCSTIGGPSLLSSHFVCDATATTPRLSNFSLTENNCVNQVIIHTSAACGGGDRNTDGGNNPERPPVSTLVGPYSTPGFYYAATMRPRSSSDPDYLPRTMTNPQRVLSGTNDAVQRVDIGFDFFFYGTPYRAVNISTNGLLQFGEGSMTTGPLALSTLSSMTNNWPIISAFWADLINEQSDFDIPYPGYIAYSTEGEPPNRQFIVRFHLVDHYAYRFFPAVTGVSFDVVLSESTAGESRDIVVHYYRVDPNPTGYVSVGLRSDVLGTTAYTGVHNRELISASLAGRLAGATITYNYTGPNPQTACSFNGYSLTSLRGSDLVWTNTSTGRTFYHSVCGLVTAPACLNSPVTAVSSLCETEGMRGLFSASTWNPAGATWAQLDNGIQMTTQSGTYCPSPLAAPRLSIIKYVCDPTVATARIEGVVVAPACTYTTTVLTSAVCQPVIPSSSSTGSQPSVSSSSSSASDVPSSSTGQVSSSTAEPSTAPVPVPSSSTAPSVPSSSAPSSSASVVPSSTASPVSSTAPNMPSSTAAPSSTADVTPVPSSSAQVVPVPSSSAMPSSSAVQPQPSSSATQPQLSSTADQQPSQPSSSSTGSTDGGSSDDGSKSSSLSGGAIAGIVIGVIVGALLLLALALWFCVFGGKNKSGAQRLEEESQRHNESFEGSQVGVVNSGDVEMSNV